MVHLYGVRNTPYRRLVLLRIAQTGVIAQGCALFFRTKLLNSHTGISNFAHIGVSAPLCDKNLRKKTFKKTIAQLLFVVVVSHIQRIGCQPEKTTLHGGQSRSWSAEQGKENKRKSLAAYPPPPPPHCSFGENK